EAENVIPAAAVETGGVLAQFVENLIHFERGENGFNQHRGANGPARDADLFLREEEHVVPEPRFEVALHLGQIEVGAGALRDQRLCVVEEIEAEIEERSGDLLAVDEEMAFGKMPATRTDQEHRLLFHELVALAFGARVSDIAADGLAQVDLAIDEVFP